jgi:hypothetical protein
MLNDEVGGREEKREWKWTVSLQPVLTKNQKKIMR